MLETKENWLEESPTEPGVYWFCSKFPQVYKEYGMEIRELVLDHEGKLFVREDNSDWDWGPDPRYLHATQPGFWCKLTPPKHPMGLDWEFDYEMFDKGTI